MGQAEAIPNQRPPLQVVQGGQSANPGQEPVEGGKQSEGSSAGLIAGLFLLGSLPFIFVLGTALGILHSGGPNPSGSSAPQSIDARPNSPVSQLIAAFKSDSSVDDYLRNNSQLITDYTAKLTLFIQKIQTNDPAYASIPNKDKILTVAQNMVNELAQIQSATANSDKTAAAAAVAAFQQNITTLDGLATPPVAALAKQLADANAASGYTAYPYSKDNRAQLPTTGTGASDGSSFVSYLLRKAGNATFPIETTAALYAAASKGQYGLTIVTQAPDGSTLSNAEISSNIKAGDIILSGDQSYSGSGAGGAQAHAVMYIGDDQIAESTTLGSKNGVQLVTLEDRLKKPNQVIIRWKGFAQ